MDTQLKTVAIIQARMGSTRLAGKVLSDIAGKTMIERVIERTCSARLIDKTIVAISNDHQDDVLASYLEKLSIPVFRGSSNDVLKRFYDCASQHNADIIVRITADDPLKDARIIDHAIKLMTTGNFDYCSNTLEPSYPEGLDVEVLRFSALEAAHNNAVLASDREHVTPYIWKNPEQFMIHNFKSERDLSSWRWTVDKAVDIKFMNRVFEHFEDQPLVSYVDVIAWLDNNPDVLNINSGILRNEGYLNSVKMEKS